MLNDPTDCREHWCQSVVTGELRIGRRVEPFTAEELRDADKLPVLRAYLHKWAWEVGQFFEGVDKDSSDEELAAIAPDFPVFEVHEAR